MEKARIPPGNTQDIFQRQREVAWIQNMCEGRARLFKKIKLYITLMLLVINTNWIPNVNFTKKDTENTGLIFLGGESV